MSLAHGVSSGDWLRGWSRGQSQSATSLQHLDRCAYADIKRVLSWSFRALVNVEFERAWMTHPRLRRRLTIVVPTRAYRLTSFQCYSLARGWRHGLSVAPHGLFGIFSLTIKLQTEHVTLPTWPETHFLRRSLGDWQRDRFAPANRFSIDLTRGALPCNNYRNRDCNNHSTWKNSVNRKSAIYNCAARVTQPYWIGCFPVTFA